MNVKRLDRLFDFADWQNNTNAFSFSSKYKRPLRIFVTDLFCFAVDAKNVVNRAHIKRLAIFATAKTFEI
jgi:hypothetical protein